MGLEKRHNVRLIDISLTLFVRDLVVESFGPETREIKLETHQDVDHLILDFGILVVDPSAGLGWTADREAS